MTSSKMLLCSIIFISLIVDLTPASAKVDLEKICKKDGLKVGISGHFPPFLFLSGSTASGIDVEVAQHVYRSLCPDNPVKITLVNSKLGEALIRLREKETDVVIAAVGSNTPLEDRQDLAYSYPYFRGGLGMAVKVEIPTTEIENKSKPKKLHEIEKIIDDESIQEKSPYVIFGSLIDRLRLSGQAEVYVAVEKESSAERFIKAIKEKLDKQKGQFIKIISVPATEEAPGNIFSTRANIAISDDVFLERAVTSLKDWMVVKKVIKKEDHTEERVFLLERGDIAVVVRKEDVDLLKEINIGISQLWETTETVENPVYNDKPAKMKNSGIVVKEAASPCMRSWNASKLQANLKGKYDITKFEQTGTTREWSIEPGLNLDLPTEQCPIISFFANYMQASYLGVGLNYANRRLDSPSPGRQEIQTVKGTLSLKFKSILGIIPVSPRISIGGGLLLRGKQEFEVGKTPPEIQKNQRIFNYGIFLEKKIAERFALSLSYNHESTKFFESNLVDEWLLGISYYLW